MQKNIFFISIFDFLIDIPYRISIVSRYGSSNFIYIEIVYSNGPIENHENSFLETEEEGAEILFENQISRVLYSQGIKTCRGPKLEQIHKRSVSFSHFFPKILQDRDQARRAPRSLRTRRLRRSLPSLLSYRILTEP